MRPTLPATPLARVCLTIWAEAGAVERAASRAHGGSAIGHNEIGRMSTAVATSRTPGRRSARIGPWAPPRRGGVAVVGAGGPALPRGPGDPRAVRVRRTRGLLPEPLLPADDDHVRHAVPA